MWYNEGMNNAVVYVLGAVALGVIGLFVFVWRKMAGDMESLRTDLMEAQKQLEIERALRQQELVEGEERAREREASLKELMSATVSGAIEKFKTASGEQLRSNGAEFAEFSKKSLADILDPLKQRIREYDERADKVHQGNTTLGAELKGYVRTIMDSATKIQSETTGFRNDLKFNNKFQGDFGEARLELVLDRCGFVKGEDYVMQSGSDDKIPDCQLFDHLTKKVIVIDSKMSWKNYVEGFASENPEARAKALDEHVKSVRKQIDNLAGKRYPEKKLDKEGYSYAPFTIMFIPSDGALVTALEKDCTLLQYASERNVYITSPLNLFNLLKLLKTCLGNFDFAENLKDIANEARNVVDRIDSLFSEFEDLGTNLTKARSAYDKVLKRLTDGSPDNKSSVLKSANKMIALSVKHDKLKSKTMTSVNPELIGGV